MSRYAIRFLPMDVTIETDSESPMEGRDGLPGSILAVALANDIAIDHACGGVCACSTCHVRVTSGIRSLPAASEAEEDMLDMAAGLSLESRLACQAVPDGGCDLVVEIPEWNRNHVSEDH